MGSNGQHDPDYPAALQLWRRAAREIQEGQRVSDTGRVEYWLIFGRELERVFPGLRNEGSLLGGDPDLTH